MTKGSSNEQQDEDDDARMAASCFPVPALPVVLAAAVKALGSPALVLAPEEQRYHNILPFGLLVFGSHTTRPRRVGH